MISAPRRRPLPRRAGVPQTWTILIPTLGERAALFARLLAVVLPQTEPYDGRVRVLGWWSHGTPSIGVIRDALLAQATTDYVSFVDDDDLVPGYYVDRVMSAIADRPDHVGFQVEYLEEGRRVELIDHSLRHGRWGRNRRVGLFRDVTHIDPIRTTLARRATFDVVPAGVAEDQEWVGQVRRHVRTETYIPHVMYHYLWSERVSAWRRPDLIRQVGVRPQVDHPHFSWHPGCTS